MFQKYHVAYAVFFALSNDHSGEGVDQDQEFWVIDVIKWCFEEQWILYYYTFFFHIFRGTEDNDTCGKMRHMGTIHRGFSVYVFRYVEVYVFHHSLCAATKQLYHTGCTADGAQNVCCWWVEGPLALCLFFFSPHSPPSWGGGDWFSQYS